MSKSEIQRFEEELNKNKPYEKLIATLTGAKLSKSREYDLEIPDDSPFPLSGKVELKTCHQFTKNLCVKVLSDTRYPDELAGPFKCRELGIPWIAFLRTEFKQCYWFLAADLAKHIEESKTKYKVLKKPVEGKYETFSAESILVPFIEVKPLIKHVQKISPHLLVECKKLAENG